MRMTRRDRILASALAVVAAAYVATMMVSQKARAQNARMFEACVVDVGTTSTTLSELIDAQPNCSRDAIGGYVKIKVVGAVSVCVGGGSGTTGNPGSLAAGNKCFPLTTGQEFPSIIPTNQMTLRVETATSLVAVASAQGGA